MKSFFSGFLKQAQQRFNKIEESKIPKIILKGNQKTQVVSKIEEIVFKAKFERISPEMEDICELVHYSALRDQPVRMDYIEKLLPTVNFKNYDEESYNEWLRYKYGMESQEGEIKLDLNKREKEDPSFNSQMKRTDKIINAADIRAQSKMNRK